ncbi:MAG: anthranilate synthase component I [Pirellulaceae bacterium]|nr:MAG: anthranilate synthase component I [Pirellulaceae bacterium]GIW93162.1 MAG: anthranilate synthase component I [Pirellulaceae bacterium]
MKHYPTFEQFAALARSYSAVPVYRRLLSDGLTPVLAFVRLDSGSPACLFESVIGGEKVGRYSILATEPYEEVLAWGNRVVVRGRQGSCARESDDPLEFLRERVYRWRAAHLAELPPFCGGAVGYAGYDVVRYTEHLPNAPPDDRGLPDLSFAFYDRLAVFDNVQKTLFAIALARLPEASSHTDTVLRSAYESACRGVDELVERLSAPGHDLAPADIDVSGPVSLPYVSNFTQQEFEQAVRRCVEYIRAGDIFQVVISQRLAVPLRCPPLEIYRTLRVVNPSPFMFFLRTPEVTLVGSSPEIMCRVVDGVVTVRPLAGTRPRGATPEEDQRLEAELLADAKERAEHVMLVDLGRNDVGRVARFGTVKLSDVMVVERYSHVMHITSNVSGELAEGKDAFDALRSCLPAGTVSGAPKVRAMQIIDEIEPHRRGPYAGAVGYFDFSGNMDTCIALRTIVVQEKTAYIQAGAGIVADSDPTREYVETLNKARGLLKAIELTEQRLA